MSMGTGAINSTSSKQKIDTKSSTESELVAIDAVLPQALWTKYFLEGQGYGTDTLLYEDNQSTIKLADNGKASSGKGTRHINIRYFFITDRIARKEVAVQYCPTKQMVADYFTKPLQGELFYKFRDQIMGVVPMDSIHSDHRSVLDQDLSDRKSSDEPKKPRSILRNKSSPSKKGDPHLNKDGSRADKDGSRADKPPQSHQSSEPQRHQSWADVVRSNPPKAANNTLLPLVKR